jgi:hypothetical protein
MSDSQQTWSPPPSFNAGAQPPVPKPPTNGLGLTSLILGLVAFVGAFIPVINYVTGVAAIAGLVLGIIAVTRAGRPKGLAKAGIAASAVALVLSIVLAIVYTIGFVALVRDARQEALDIGSGGSTSSGPSDGPVESTDPTLPEAPTGGELGTRGNPAPIGTTIVTFADGVEQYEITLGAPTLNADAIIAAENSFNEAPPAGLQYAILPVTVVYTGATSGTPYFDLDFAFVSAAGTTHTSVDTLAVGPTPLTDINELYPGGTGTGNVVIAIPTADAASGTWAVSTLFGDESFYSAAQ